LDVYRVSRNHKAARKGYKAKTGLYKTQEQARNHTCAPADYGYQPPFGNEDLPDQRGSCSHAYQDRNVFFFLQNKHAEGTQHIAGYDQQYESQKHENYDLFRCHHPVQGFILLVTGQYRVAVSQMFF